jgi:hypothetical protein
MTARYVTKRVPVAMKGMLMAAFREMREFSVLLRSWLVSESFLTL